MRDIYERHRGVWGKIADARKIDCDQVENRDLSESVSNHTHRSLACDASFDRQAN